MSFVLTEFDADLVTKVTMQLSKKSGSGPKVKFQFPPIIKSDNKTIDYTEKSMGNIEPLVTFNGSGARQISMSWSYVVTNANTGGQRWTPEAVATQVKQIRSYFYTTVQDFYDAQNTTTGILIINFGAYDIVGKSGESSYSFRSDSINVSHSDTIVKVDSTYYALRTDIDMKLKLWSRGETKSESGKSDPLIDVSFLKPVQALSPVWR